MQVVAEVKEPSTPRLCLMMGIVASVCGLLYLFVGLLGYLQFSNCVCNNISVSFGTQRQTGLARDLDTILNAPLPLAPFLPLCSLPLSPLPLPLCLVCARVCASSKGHRGGWQLVKDLWCSL